MTDTQKEIINIIIDEMGLDPETLGDISLKTSIKSLLIKLGHISEEDLLLELRKNPKIIRDLIEEVKVPETWFFRDIEAYNLLEKFAKENIISRKIFPLKILSAPCSTGEEAYSIAITLKKIGYNESQYKIRAVDISDVNIQKAKKAIYTKSSLRSLDQNIIEQYFNKNDFRYELIDSIRNSSINFQTMNLVKDLHKFNNKEFDVIFFKNLLIYLNENSRQYILSNIKRCLKDDGILFVGVSELNYFIRNGFETISHNLSFACKIKPIQAHKISEKKVEKKAIFISKPTNIKSPTIKKIETKESKITNNDLDFSKIKKLMDLGKYIEAEIEIDNIIKRNINHYEIFFNLGLIKYVNKSYNLAKEYFLKSLYLEPNNYEALIYMSIVEKELGSVDKSENYRVRAEKIYNRAK